MGTGVADYQTAVSDGGVAFHLNLFVKYIVNGYSFYKPFFGFGIQKLLFSRKSQSIRFLGYRGSDCK